MIGETVPMVRRARLAVRTALLPTAYPAADLGFPIVVLALVRGAEQFVIHYYAVLENEPGWTPRFRNLDRPPLAVRHGWIAERRQLDASVGGTDDSPYRCVSGSMGSFAENNNGLNAFQGSWIFEPALRPDCDFLTLEITLNTG